MILLFNVYDKLVTKVNSVKVLNTIRLDSKTQYGSEKE